METFHPLPHHNGSSERLVRRRVVSTEEMALDLDVCEYIRVIRVGTAGWDDGYQFSRTTCYKFLPLPPTSVEDFLLAIDREIPVEVSILPPVTYYGALESLSYGSVGHSHTIATVGQGSSRRTTWAPRVRREETFIDYQVHPFDVFCAVYLKADGAFEVAIILSVQPQQKIDTRTMIFAPAAWQHAAEIVCNRGAILGDKYRLICRLQDGTLINLDVHSAYVLVPEGWSSMVNAIRV
ncbi:hypothetical protein B0H16DRAFT_1495408 [Mycena metata]|uniref:Uncharacterized protein n=1 Tax=Mycena metata TaxID=1033252 RepID=A0AAD7P0L8_9AGAR|nr:hypothetical protein B0H16DRAFT_1495408 [Mycena metata]